MVCERPVVRRELCLRRRLRRDCDICLAHCPQRAIRLDDGPRVDESCDGCGICAVACPSGALMGSCLSWEDIIDRVGSAACKRGEVDFCYCCARGKPKGHLRARVPCLARLAPVELLAPLLAGARKVMLVSGNCARCRHGVGNPVLEGTLKFTRVLCAMLALPYERIVRVEAPLPAGVASEDVIPVNRRRFFGELFRSAAGLLASFIHELPPDEEQKADAPRVALRALLVRYRSRTGKTEESKSSVAADELPLADIAVSRGCVACGACEKLCPRGALVLGRVGNVVRIENDAWRCTGCGTCMTACPRRLIVSREELCLEELLLGESPRILTEVIMKQCSQCGFDYPADEACPVCTKRGG